MKNWVQGVKKPYKAKRLTIKKKRKLYKYDEKEIIRDVLQGKSIEEIVKKYHITADVIYNLKKRHNLVIHHTKNHYDFSTALELNDKSKAYLIGLIDDISVKIHSNYRELRLTTTHVTYLGLARQVFKDKPYNIRLDKRIKKYKDIKREVYEMNVIIAMPPYKYLIKGKERRQWVKWAINNHFLEFLSGLIDADGSIIVSKRGEYLVMITNSKKYLIDEVIAKLRKLGLNPLIRYDRISRCYKIQLRRKSEVKKLLEQIKLRHPEKVFLKYLVLSDKFSTTRKSEMYRKYRRHVKQRSQKWIEREYGLSLLRYYPPLPLFTTQ